ncbi:DUF2808 domain-containing protein [Leptothermofonsia sichuanensis E412]|uniref:DUF2808 domain-containing protein n=1 Tax=Leptothermofonsia sichuanensis TaxID=2917832 RepID=UPI001CA6B2A1|nr:DUF2808 domain-containing protein [Leptothermofonsia sichuanensis]QZZ19094.1 DUF2808 domain-containing protein [Leptothermofonsia sichuanensis E412]
MKGLVFTGASALLVAIAASGLASPASARPGITSGPSPSSMLMAGETSMTFNFTAPFITSSGVRGTAHFIRLAVVGMSLNDLMISIPSQMEEYNAIRVINQNGQDVPAKISKDKNRVAIVFDQPVAQGTYLEVLFTGVQMRRSDGDTLFYGVTAERTGIRGEIPVGTARVQIPSRS